MRADEILENDDVTTKKFDRNKPKLKIELCAKQSLQTDFQVQLRPGVRQLPEVLITHEKKHHVYKETLNITWTF